MEGLYYLCSKNKGTDQRLKYCKLEICSFTINAGFKLGLASRVKPLLPPENLEKRDSHMEMLSAKLQHFHSL